MNFRLGSSVWDLSLGHFRLRTFTLELSLGNFRFGNVVWELLLSSFRLAILARKFSLGNFSLGTLAWETAGNWAPEAGWLAGR